MCDVEQLYEITAEIMVLGHSPEDAKERAENMVVINDMLTDPVVTDWSHFKENDEFRQRTIERITRQVKTREGRR